MIGSNEMKLVDENDMAHVACLNDMKYALSLVQISALDRKALAAINCYNPGLSAAWMFQRSMSIRPGQKTPRNFVNRLLGVNFKSMSRAGDWVLKPFMQVRT